MFPFHFYLSLFHVLYFMSIPPCIFCIVRYLAALGIAQKIKVMGSLQIDDLFTINT